jgi:hypothetical protein
MSAPSPFNGKRAAVSLTYDDALDCQLDLVAPALEQRGFRGTFYTPVKQEFITRWDDWATVSARGHELGNHTLFHPCRGRPDWQWVKPCMDLKTYDLDRWGMEVDLANALLDRAEGKSGRSFGNTCHNTCIGPDENPIPLDEHMFPRFVAARGYCVESDETIDPLNMNLGNLGNYAGDGMSFDDLSSTVKRAVERGHWVIFTFHFVGPIARYLTIPESIHTAFLDFLNDLNNSIWVAPVRDVVKQISKTPA